MRRRATCRFLPQTSVKDYGDCTCVVRYDRRDQCGGTEQKVRTSRNADICRRGLINAHVAQSSCHSRHDTCKQPNSYIKRSGKMPLHWFVSRRGAHSSSFVSRPSAVEYRLAVLRQKKLQCTVYTVLRNNNCVLLILNRQKKFFESDSYKLGLIVYSYLGKTT